MTRFVSSFFLSAASPRNRRKKSYYILVSLGSFPSRFITLIHLISCTPTASYAPHFICLWLHIPASKLVPCGESPRDRHLDYVLYLGVKLFASETWGEAATKKRKAAGDHSNQFSICSVAAFNSNETQIKLQNFWNSNWNFPNYKILTQRAHSRKWGKWNAWSRIDAALNGICDKVRALKDSRSLSAFHCIFMMQ